MSEETNLEVIPEPISGPVRKKEQYRDWLEYRQWVGMVRCIACQKSGGKDKLGNIVEPVGTYETEIFKVSDAHHVVSRGAGGPDSENVVPLCRFHHGETHKIGKTTFQINYGINFTDFAKFLTEQYIQKIENGGTGPAIARAMHELLVSRIFFVDKSVRDLSMAIDEAKDKRISGRYIWEWLGFNTIYSWVSSPVSSGGLGIQERSFHRYLIYAKTIKLLGEENIPEGYGHYRANAIYPLLERQREDPEKVKELFEKSNTMSLPDLIAWRNKELGKTDPREVNFKVIRECISSLLQSLNAEEISDEELDSFIWSIYSKIDSQTSAFRKRQL